MRERPRNHQMTPERAWRIAALLHEINEVADLRGRCVECGEPNRDGCDCWLQDMFNCVPFSILDLLDQVDKQRQAARNEREIFGGHP